MSLNSPQGRKPSNPTKIEIDDQVQKLCADEQVRGEKRGDLLQYLVRIQREGRYAAPFTLDKPRPTGQRILFEFYRYRAQEDGEQYIPQHEDETIHKGKKLTKELVHALVKHYKKSKDRVVIKIRTSRGFACAPEFKYKPRSTAKIAPARLKNVSQPARTDAEQPSSEETPRAFEEFFGDGASTQDPQGLIILQSDRIDDVVTNLVPDLLNAAASVLGNPKGRESRLALTEETARALLNETFKPTTRFYKARSWINRWDTFGALAVQGAFLKHNIKAPKIVLSEHLSPDRIAPSAPFEISMGLGFSDRTDLATEDSGQWLYISRKRYPGDSVALHKKLLQRVTARRKIRFVRAADDRPQFVRLLPSGWDDKEALGRWLLALRNPNQISVRDYAMIFRHTRWGANERRHVHFVLAGFTERGTAAAGWYLAQKWPNFWRTHVENKVNKGSGGGDFVLLIEGPSRPDALTEDQFSEWQEDPAFPAITPEVLRKAKIECEWASRLRKSGKP
jgi:hypothetical protein